MRPIPPRKAQMELLGLAIIVVIVTIAMFTVLTFVVSKPPRLLHARFVEKELAQNMLGGMLKTTARDCKQLSLGDLLQDCGNYESTGGSILCENGQYSCQYMEEDIGELLNQTLYNWTFSYRLRAFTSSPDNPLIPSDAYLRVIGNNINIFNPWNCHDLDEKEAPGVQPIPLDTGTLMVTLDICKG